MHEIYDWQREIWQRLTQNRAFRNHALLLKGRQGIGKYVFARQLAKLLLCSAPSTEQKACGVCSGCGWFEQDCHPNFYQIMPEALTADRDDQGRKDESEEKSGRVASKKSVSQQIGIEQIRKLTDFVYMTGHQNGYKVILIYPAEAMNSAAANALLKKLEEPPENVLFLLVTHQVQQLLPTIRSRCQQIAMPAPDVATSVAWLKQQQVSHAEDHLAAAGFSPLTALQFDQGENAAQYEQFIRQIGYPDRLDPLSLADTLQQTDLSVVVGWLQKWCYDLISYRSTGRIRYFPNQSISIKALGDRMDLMTCITFAKDLNARQRLSHHPLNSRLFLEEMFMAYLAIMPGD